MNNVSIRIISADFQLLGEIDDYESLQFIRRFYEIGEFELHINLDKNNTDKLEEGNLILLGNKLNKVGIIMHAEIEDDDNGSTTLIIKGPTLKGIMSRRLIVPPVGLGYDSQTGSKETILKTFVNNNVVNPIDPKRKIPQVIIAADQQRGSQDAWRSKFEVLSDKLTEIGEYTQIGWDVALDITNNTWVFDIAIGKNLVARQDILPPVIFSTEFDNIKNPYYTSSQLDCYNVGYAGGQGEEENRLIQQIGEQTGFDRRETFLDCSQATDVTELVQQGKQQLDKLKDIRTFEFEIIPNGSFLYEEDYDLGDYVTAQDKKRGISMDAQIIELKETYEVNGFTLEATFGTNIPTIIDKIKQVSKRMPLIEQTGSISGNIDGGSFV